MKSQLIRFIKSLIPEPRGPKWSFKVVADDRAFVFKNHCPYCHSHLTYRATGWEECEQTGLWIATCFDCDCASMPELVHGHHDDWEDWFTQHTRHPYEIQMPVDIKAHGLINSRYRFYIRESVSDRGAP